VFCKIHRICVATGKLCLHFSFINVSELSRYTFKFQERHIISEICMTNALRSAFSNVLWTKEETVLLEIYSNFNCKLGTLKSSTFSTGLRGISRLSSAFILLWWCKREHGGHGGHSMEAMDATFWRPWRPPVWRPWKPHIQVLVLILANYIILLS